MSDVQHNILGVRLGESTGIKTAILFGILLLLGLVAVFVDFSPSLSHLDIRMLSGTESGRYHRIVTDLAARVDEGGGHLDNVSSAGSVDNLSRLVSSTESCDVQFAMVQDGLDWPDKGVELLARLPTAETVFFLAAADHQFQSFVDLKQKRVGIGPEGSGTAQIAEDLFQVLETAAKLDIQSVHGTVDQQLAQLRSGKLDLVIVVIGEDSQIIRHSLVKGSPGSSPLSQALTLVSFDNLPAVAHHLDRLSMGTIVRGQFQPLSPIPPTDMPVIRVDTLVIGNGCARRSEVDALLLVLSEEFPSLSIHNSQTGNATGLPMNDTAASFFSEGGPNLVASYFPRVLDLMPLSNWIHVVMGLSIFFNFMALWHRFRLWRIDATRVLVERRIIEVMGVTMSLDEIEALSPTAEHDTPQRRAALTEILARLETIRGRCRKHSLSVLVPMGQEMAYRFQESMLERAFTVLRGFEQRLEDRPI